MEMSRSSSKNEASLNPLGKISVNYVSTYLVLLLKTKEKPVPWRRVWPAKTRSHRLQPQAFDEISFNWIIGSQSDQDRNDSLRSLWSPTTEPRLPILVGRTRWNFCQIVFCNFVSLVASTPIIPLENTLNLPFNLIFSPRISKRISRKRISQKRTAQWWNWRYRRLYPLKIP